MRSNLLRRASMLGLCALLLPHAAIAAPTFQLVASEFTNGVPWLKAGVPTAISDDGKVVFATEAIGTFADGVTTWNAGVLNAIPVAASNLDGVNSVAVRSAGDVAFVADRKDGTDSYRGVYRTTTSAGAISTYYENLQASGQPLTRFVAMSDNGTTAFSTIVSGVGSIQRGPIAGSPSVLRAGSGIFFNTQKLDVNNAGTTAVQMEYGSTVGPLSRAILAFDTPGQTITQTLSTVEQTSVGTQPMPKINSAGTIAFSLNTIIEMKFYTPPNVFGPTFSTITLEPGVYVSNPVLLGTLPRTFTQIANTTGAFASFGDVSINDAGQVVFEAALDDANFGLFNGSDAVLDKLIKTGETLGTGPVVSIIELGDLNNSGQFSFLTSKLANDRQIWVGTLPEPASVGLVAIPVIALMRRRR